jgi:hypothetical protein
MARVGPQRHRKKKSAVFSVIHAVDIMCLLQHCVCTCLFEVFEHQMYCNKWAVDKKVREQFTLQYNINSVNEK